MAKTFAELSTAAQFRDLMRRMVAEQIERLRPRYTYATVHSIDRVNRKCAVLYPGVTDPAKAVTVGMGSIQPANTGQTVRIEGIGNDRFVADVMGLVYDQHFTNSEATTLAMLRSNFNLSGGGIITVESGHIKWSARFIAISIGRGSHWTNNGHYSLAMPGVGVVIPGYGGAVDQTVTAAGFIPLSAWYALWAIPTLGGTSAEYSYALTNYTSNFVVPPHWIFVAVRNSDNGMVRFGNGQTHDYWRTPALANGWTSNSDGPTIGYRREGDRVVLRGLAQGGASGTTVFTLPAGFRPLANTYVGSLLYDSGAALHRPVNIGFLPSGAVNIYYSGVTTLLYASLNDVASPLEA